MRVKIKYSEPNVEPVVVTIKPASQITLERTHKAGFMEDHPLEATYWMAWHTLKVSEPFDEWVETLDELELDEDGDAVGEGEAPSSGTS